jgi:hypothetical protein
MEARFTIQSLDVIRVLKVLTNTNYHKRRIIRVMVNLEKQST